MTPQPQNLITDDELLQYSLLWAEAHSADTDGLGTVHTRAREFEKAIRSRPAPLTQNDGGNCMVICQHCGKVTQVQCKKDGD